ncbi:MAG TPA: fibrobacter succinogenes major paralogous domain-containing protein, partial [Bacteroidales bacterium]|nr:fibrobacter succinogenes major paralogous domain-containing protein [Bacteroidales bacterium]
VVHCVPADTRCSLTASLAGNEKVYRLTNRKVGPTTSLNIELCANQLPYQHDGIDIYRDTTLIYPSSLGCDSSVVITLTVHQLPDIMIVGNPTPCYGSDVILIAQSADTNDTYLWSTSATDTTDTLRLPALTMDTTISIIVSNDHDGEVTCIAYDTIKLVLLPVYSHHDTITICSAQLPYTYGNTYVAFTEEGDQEPVILQAANGCDSTVHVYMYVYDDTRINDTVEICANELPLAYYDSIFAVGTVTGDYEVHVQNSTGCDTVYLLRLTVNPVPTATLTPTEAVIFVSENIQLIAITEDNLQWSTGETNDTITVTPTAPGINTYYLSLSNEHGCVDTLYSNIYLETCGAGYPVVDIENNSYETHIYGSSCWMVENLRSTVYSDGQPIPGVMEYSSSVYPDAAHNVSIFGRLYDWYSATRTVPGQIPDASLIQGVCPDGWRLPTYNEYLELMGTLGYSLADLRSTNHWLDDAGNNSSHFDMRPAGYYDATANQFMNLHGNTYFITITTILEEITTFETFSCGYNCPDLLRYIGNKTNVYSVRCVKNFGQRNGQSISG